MILDDKRLEKGNDSVPCFLGPVDVGVARITTFTTMGANRTPNRSEASIP